MVVDRCGHRPQRRGVTRLPAGLLPALARHVRLDERRGLRERLGLDPQLRGEIGHPPLEHRVLTIDFHQPLLQTIQLLVGPVQLRAVRIEFAAQMVILTAQKLNFILQVIERFEKLVIHGGSPVR